MYYVAGTFEGRHIWAALHREEVCWTDHKPDAAQFSEERANRIAAGAPSYLEHVRLMPMLNYLAA